SFDYVFAPPDAGTFWYHPHVGAAHQVDRGLYGVLIVEEADPLEPLSDVVMVIDDWWLLDSGAIEEEAFGDMMVAANGGRMGNWLTVNSISRPRLAAPPGERVRLRLVNAANARVMRLVFRNADPRLLAIDGQPLPSPRALAGEPLELPPGGRADVGLPRGLDPVTVAVDIEGEILDLAFIDRKVEPEPEPEPEPESEPEGEVQAAPKGDDRAGAEADDKVQGKVFAKVVSVPRAKPKAQVRSQAKAEAKPEAQPSAPTLIEADAGDFAPLPANPLPATLDLAAALAVSLVLEGGAHGGMLGAVMDGRRMTMGDLLKSGKTWAMNGQAGLGDDPLLTTERGRVVAMTVENKTGWTHALHLHGHHVRVVEDLARDNEDPVWRDTVLIEPQTRLTVAFLADNPGKWVLECHVLEHGEAGMMTWLKVT
ncbi:MAG TPA: multicopper oxidase domain-containing protein, partial [Aestuariivirgaceae bacterium]|nr:multicopper oxidase domain-containing protein [Aestuariivirgaceae bacterium]